MFITTKTGDDGWTDFGGKRVKKSSREIEIIGNLDELQAILLFVNKKLAEDIGRIMSGKETMVDLDKEIKKIEKQLKPVNKFMVFTKKKAIYLNWARTVTRRTERFMIYDLRFKNYNIYINRLSDYLYLLALKEEQK
jgi:cob(I)alamin adenosyltransferase